MYITTCSAIFSFQEIEASPGLKVGCDWRSQVTRYYGILIQSTFLHFFEKHDTGYDIAYSAISNRFILTTNCENFTVAVGYPTSRQCHRSN